MRRFVCYREVFGRLTPLMALYGVRFAMSRPDVVPPRVRATFVSHIIANKFGELTRRQFFDEFLPLFSDAAFITV
jgi:hypothetical protein